MTVISAMKFNEQEGAIVSDEQSSRAHRKYDTATKIQKIEGAENTIALFGGAGAMDILMEAFLAIENYVKESHEIKNCEQIAEITGSVMAQLKNRYVDNYLKSLFGLTSLEFISGQATAGNKTAPIDRSLMEQYARIISYKDEGISELLYNSFLILTHDSGGIKLFNASMNLAKPIPIANFYCAIGSGLDVADHILSDFFETIPRDERIKIESVHGLSALLYATERASTRNIGVGGTPYISVVTGGKIITPSESNSRLAMEIVKATKRGFLPQEFEKDALTKLVYQDNKFEEVEEQMWKTTSDKERLNRMLRGYKV